MIDMIETKEKFEYLHKIICVPTILTQREMSTRGL